MINKEKIEQIIAEQWQRPDLFMTKLSVSSSNDIRVYIDGDESVSLEDCVTLSRIIESSLDREEEDFALEVMTHGVSESLSLPRQYIKNIGRQIKIRTQTQESIEGELRYADDQKIQVFYTFKERLEGRKKKVTIEKNIDIPYDQIQSGIVKVSFK